MFFNYLSLKLLIMKNSWCLFHFGFDVINRNRKSDLPKPHTKPNTLKAAPVKVIYTLSVGAS